MIQSITECSPTRTPGSALRSVAVLAAPVWLGFGAAAAATLDDMTGCWVTKEPAATSLETDSTKPDGVKLIFEKMLLIFSRMDGTDYLVFGRIFEFDEGITYVLGPQYQNGVFDPIGETLTFGFPKGGLDTVRLLDLDTLLYIHKKSSTLSAMSVRRMSRLGCDEAEALERSLLEKRKS